jgi:hypothetical protein
MDGEIVVCGAPDKPLSRLPYDSSPNDPPTPSNPHLTGMGALAQTATPCATLQGGCASGVDLFGGGTAVVRLIGKLIDPDSCCERPGEATNPGMLIGDAIGGIKRAFGKKPDKSGRVAISLEAPPPVSSKGRLRP